MGVSWHRIAFNKRPFRPIGMGATMANHNIDINNKSYDTMKESILLKVIWAGLLATFIGGIYNIVNNYPPITIIVHALGCVLLLWQLHRYKNEKRQYIAPVVLIYFCFIYTPLAWISLGGLYSSMAYVVHVFFVLIFVLLDGKTNHLFLICYGILTVVLVSVNLAFPPFTHLPTPPFPMAFSYLITLCIIVFICHTVKNQLERLVVNSHKASVTDMLTGLYNHRYLAEMLREMEMKYSLYGKEQDYTIAVLDLDDFKQVNDKYGHSTGDDLLHELGTHFAQTFSIHTIGRYGGDEFLVIFTEAEFDQCLSLCQTFLQQTRQKDFTQHHIHVTFSAGLCRRSDLPTGDLFTEADRLLYLAKSAGKNQVLA